jgi:hypothetical protein
MTIAMVLQDLLKTLRGEMTSRTMSSGCAETAVDKYALGSTELHCTPASGYEVHFLGQKY